MNTRKLFAPLFAPIIAGALLLCPSDAAAVEVMCANDDGECTVSNDGQSFFSCDCVEAGGTGGSGGDEYEGLSEEELLEVCNELLVFCELGGDGDGDMGSSTGGNATTGPGDTEGGETEGDTEGTTEGSTSTSGDGDGDGDGETGDTEGDTGDDPTTGNSSTGDSDSDSGATEGGETGDSSGESGETDSDSGGESGEGSGEDSGGDSDGDSDSDSGDSNGETGASEGGGADDEVGGCSVTPNGSGLGLVALSLLGLLGLRRRERT